MKALRTVAVLAALCFLCMVWGGLAVRAGWFPGRELRKTYEGLRAAKHWVTGKQDRHSPHLWHPDRAADRAGVVCHDPTAASAGYSLYTGGHTQKAFLIAMDGTVVHEWHAPYRALWSPGGAIRKPQPPYRICWRRVHVFPNGDLLALVEAVQCLPWGYGLVKLDRDSNVLWTFLEQAHGDFAVADDGRIYTFTHRIRREAVPGVRKDPIFNAAGLRPPFLEEHLTVLSPDGRKLQSLSLVDALMDSHLRKLVDYAPASPHGLFLTAVSLHVLDASDAARWPWAEAGHVLVALPYTRALVLFDLDSAAAVWGMRGPWVHNFDADILPNGALLLFDGCGHTAAGGPSRVLEVDPLTCEIAWSFHGTPGRPFASLWNGSQQRLAGGNTLIAESEGGRLLEVTREGDIVWEYVLPVRGGPNGSLRPALLSAVRLAADYFDGGFLALLEPERTGAAARKSLAQAVREGASR